MEQGTFISKKYNEDEFAKIVETEKEIEELKKVKQDYLKYIHCNGCFKKCPLSNANCGRGKNLGENLRRKK